MRLSKTTIFVRKPLAFASICSIAVLSACGGSDDSPAAPPNTMVTLTGSVMVDKAVRNALVCMDLNANNACDTDEPASARTGADGVYSITYDSAKVTTQQVAGASLIAPMVPGATTAATTTIDAASPNVGLTEKAYVLKQVPGKAGQINPLTTLLARGIATGMTEATARTNLAAQLGITSAKIDDYQGDPAFAWPAADNARTMAKIAAAALEDGAPATVGDQSAAVVAGVAHLAGLTYTDANNYFYRTIEVDAKAAGTPGGASVRDVRAGKSNGVATTEAALYNTAFLTPTGWKRCDGTAFAVTSGTPDRDVYCGALPEAGYTITGPSLEGQSMASVVQQMQALPAGNLINIGVSTTNLLAALGSAVFPAGSATRERTTIALARPLYINSISADARPQSEATTLEQLIASKPTSGVNLTNGAGTLNLGASSSATRLIRAAFPAGASGTSGNVQYYECDLNPVALTLSNCSATETGTFRIDTVHGVRVLRFAGYTPSTINGHTRGFAEVSNSPTVASGSWVFGVRENKEDEANNVTTSVRLNATAWAAMKAQLGLQ